MNKDNEKLPKLVTFQQDDLLFVFRVIVLHDEVFESGHLPVGEQVREIKDPGSRPGNSERPAAPAAVVVKKFLRFIWLGFQDHES